MEELIEVFLGRFVVRFLGGNTRFYVLKIIGANPNYESVVGSKKEFSFSDDFMNVIIGFAVLIGIVFLGGYLISFF